MACHPSGITIDIVGLEASNHGRSCENHKVCGIVVVPDVVVRIREVQLERTNDPTGAVETDALAVYHVSGGVDCCRVGFLRRHLLRYKEEYDGVLAQVVDVFSDKSESPTDRAKYRRNRGCARAVLIEAEYRESPMKKQKTDDTQTNLSTPI